MYERPRANVKVERAMVSGLTLNKELSCEPYLGSISAVS